MIFGNLSFRGCGGQPLALVWNVRLKSQMPISPEHAFEEKSTKLLILLPLRTIYNRTFQCETPCNWNQMANSKCVGQKFIFFKIKSLWFSFLDKIFTQLRYRRNDLTKIRKLLKVLILIPWIIQNTEMYMMFGTYLSSRTFRFRYNL